jgi:hypothetical protein
MKHAAQAVILVILAVGITGCKTARVVNPGPIRVVCGSPEKMQTAIRQGLQKRKWAVTAEGPGRTLAMLYLRKHEATIAIEFSADDFSIKYVDSKNLLYGKDKKGREVIHENYNDWIMALVHDISVFGSAK